MEADQREESSKIDEILENLQELNVRLKTVENKVDKVEVDRLDNITEDHQIDVDNPDRRGQHDQDDVNFHDRGLGSDFHRDRVSDTDNDLNVPVDLQAEFAAIKDAVSKVKLPSDHRLNDQKRGIKRKDHQTLQVISKSARYVETGFKLLGTLSPGKLLTLDDYNHLYHVHLAHIRFLQDEYAALVVQGKFNPDTAQLFRAIQTNTSGLSTTALQDLKLASSLTAANTGNIASSTASTSSQSDFNWRRRGAGFRSNFNAPSSRGRGYYNNYSSGRGYYNGSVSGDVYNRYASRSVPAQRSPTRTDQV